MAEVCGHHVAVAMGSFTWAMFLFVRLARRHIRDEAAVLDSAWLRAVYPFAIYFSAAYAEPLFLLAMCTRSTR
jgi:hypothetical protein